MRSLVMAWVLAVLVGALLAVPAAAEGMCDGGRAFGQAMAAGAPHGGGAGGWSPGEMRGYSACLDVRP